MIEAAGVRVAWERVEAGADVVAKYGTPVPDSALHAIRRLGVGLKGPIGTPVGEGFRSANVMLRQSLDAFARLDAASAAEVLKEDSAIDDEFRSVLRQLITYMMEDPRTISV